MKEGNMMDNSKEHFSFFISGECQGSSKNFLLKKIKLLFKLNKFSIK